jgi:cell division protein FtsB
LHRYESPLNSHISYLFMKKLLELLRNKYFLAIVAFAVWMLFFDKNDMLSQYEYRTAVNKLQQEKDFYTKETADVKKDLAELDSNLNTAEKFAREKYFMKKDNEDVFVIVKSDSVKN